MTRKLLFIYFLSVMLALAPFAGWELANSKKALAATIGDIISPDKWLEVLKRNIALPFSKETEVKIPRPEETLDKSLPKLREISQKVREETGIDLAKFTSWLARVLKVFFQMVIDLLEKISRLLES